MKKIMLIIVAIVCATPLFAQSIPSDLRTSDPNRNRAIQQMINQYGVEKTREMLNQQQSSNQRNTYGAQSQQSKDKIVDGVYLNGNSYTRIRLKISSSYGTGGKVVAYSMGTGYSNYTGQAAWTSCYADISRTNSMFDGNAAKDYNYKASVKSNLTVYFNY